MRSVARTYGYFVAAIALTALLLCVTVEWLGFYFVPAKNPAIAEIYIPLGSGIGKIADILHAEGVIKRPRAFVLMARLKNLTSHIKAGEYEIPTEITPAKVLQLLVSGKVRYRDITFVEGWRFTQIIDALLKNPYVQHNLQDKSPQEIMALLGQPDKNPEGLFFPSTFKFARGTSDLVLLKESEHLMDRTIKKLWTERSPNLPYIKMEDALTVASLIEKETAVDSERPQVAGVILRRWQKNMLLQIDPTVIYAVGEKYTGHITKDDLKVNSPYNTYLFKGLPPTPIASPSLSSIQAALHPAEGDSLYYVSKGDGSHEFSATLAQHNIAVTKLRKLEGKD